jgi:tRNA(Ile)-lysidine synthase
MQDEFLKYLINICKCSSNSRFLLAVSGGIDSVVMTYLFHMADLNFSIAHCNFHLRGKESDIDQQFVEDLATRLGHACFVKHIKLDAIRKEQGISVQMAARDLRYAWFNELAEQEGFNYIVVAHNRNDVVETMMMNLSRGCGIRGLTGIKPVMNKIVRPLIFASRDDIVRFANEKKLKWREDLSNSQIKYERNRIRHEIIPEFEKLNPAFLQSAVETIRHLEQTEQLFDLMLKEVKKQIWTELPDRNLVNIDKLLEFPAVETILFETLRNFGLNPSGARSLANSLESISGKQFITGTHCITRDRSNLIITEIKQHIESGLEITNDTLQVSYPVYMTFRIFEKPKKYDIPVEKNIAALDADLVGFPIKLRRWQKGDAFHPLGLKGSMKLSDFLINNKVPLPDKQKVWILESNRKIIWIVGHRIDDRFKITSATSKILLIESNITS